MKIQRSLFQWKEQEKIPEKKKKETEINNLSDKEFKALVLRTLTELGKRIDKYNESFNKELEIFKKEPIRAEEYRLTEKKNALKGINSTPPLWQKAKN